MNSRIVMPAILALCCLMFAATFISLQQIRGRTDGESELAGTPWPRSTPEEQGLDSDLLVRMLKEIVDEGLKIRSVLIVRNDHLVLEAYQHPYDRDVSHGVKSVSKSVISALVGIALRDGILPTLEQPVHEYFPQYDSFGEGSLKSNITLGNLLTMTSGLDIDENGPAMNAISSQEDMIEATFARPMLTAPGESFQYCTFLTLAMTRILTEASGGDLLEFANDVLFEPLDFAGVHWGKDPQGYRFGGDQLWLRPIDMAKFGSLFLHHGRWLDRQVVPESWVNASTANRFADFDTDGYRGYGYWWWLPDDGSSRARGAFGQIITVYPEANMVVVFTGASNQDFEQLTDEYLLPAVSNEVELPPNELALDRLEQLAYDLSNPHPQPSSPLPSIASEISGVPYRLEQNNLEFAELTVWFEQPDDARLLITYGGGTLDLAVGLDNVFRQSKNVPWGMRTDGNAYAVRGKWVGDNQLELEIHEVGEPFYFDANFTFDGNEMAATWTWQPIGWEMTMSGSR